MPLNLNDLLKKAEEKGIVPQNTPASSAQFLRPWQQESVLYASNEKKLEPNLSQSKAEVGTEPEPNLSQTRAKVKPKPEPNLSQTRAKVEPKVESKLSQTRAKVEPNTPFSSLIGLQRKIVLFFHEICQIILEQQTNPLSIEFIATRCQSPKSAIRKAIQRLEQKKIIIRATFKNGRGGWTRYQLPDQIYQEILRLKNQKLEPNLSQSGAKVRTELEPQLRPNLPSSSSSLILKETTTTEQSDEWNFDITPYARFGFTISQIKQLASLGVISASDVEQSLIEFGYDLDNNALPTIKTGKINFLMGLLRSGHSYVSEGFKSEQEAIISEMARRAEGKRKKLLEEKFAAWEASLSDEERKEITKELPPQLMVLHRAHGVSNPEIRSWLFNYYLKNCF